ncbi:hypothetical protein F0562_001045 [Nyssa sinensis]|uniref:Alpha-1,4 glucan phosphorylase n=1 Tax=Nyssa sinensis TaxID=561372 RepID=A0A5J5C6V9_9ASTE|nr:hypothetical protein F0562_001045 [Nyssa sinensis]
MIGGKGIAANTNTKSIIQLVNGVGAVVNNDPEVNSYLKVVFVPNYNVSVAEMLIPGTDLSQHISTAGMEARRKLERKISFSLVQQQMKVSRLRKERENGQFKPDPQFEEAKKFIRTGAFGSYNYSPLLESIEGNSGYCLGDYFLVGHDFPSYMEAQARVDEAYKDRKRWIKMSILSTAGSGKFSSDRTVTQYAEEIWNIKDCFVP